MATPQELMRMFPQFAAGDLKFTENNMPIGEGSNERMSALPTLGTLGNVRNYYPEWDELNPNNYLFTQLDPNNMELMVKTAAKEGTVVPYSLQNGQWTPNYNAARQQEYDTGRTFQNRALLSIVGGALGSAFLGPAASAGQAAGGGGLSGIDALIAAGEGIVPIASSATPTALGSAGNAALGSGIGLSGGSSMLTVGNMMSAGKDILGGLSSINSLLGQGTTTGNQSTSSSGTRTSQTELTPEAIMRIVQMAMENPNTGLQSILNPAAGAGTFGGSNQALLTSELLTRVAGEAALRGAKTTETADTTGTTSSQTKNRSPVGNALRSIGRIFGF